MAPTNDADLCARCQRRPSLCGGLGVISYDVPVDHPMFGKLYRCPNYPVEADEERQSRFRSLSNLQAFGDKTFENFETNPANATASQRETLELAYKAAVGFANNPQGWLFLVGSFGCGKTHLAAAIGNERLKRGDSVLFVTAPDLLDHLRSTYGPSSETAYDQMFERIRSVQLLIMDDLGAENPSPWAQEKLFQLLNHRYSSQLATVITTNTDLDHLDPRIRSRLMDINLVNRREISAPDYRSPVGHQVGPLGDFERFKHMTFDRFDVSTGLNPDEQRRLSRIVSTVKHYAEDPRGWLILSGKSGSGKTHLAAAVAHTWRAQGINLVFFTIPDLLDYLRTTFGRMIPISFDQRFEVVRGASHLILDDLGMENQTPWGQEKVFQILDYRYMTGLETVITTTRRIDELDERISNRLIDQRLCRIVDLAFPPYPLRINIRR